MSNDVKSFEASWAFLSEIKKELGAASYDVRPLPVNFKSGRAKFEALFFSGDRKLISRRTAMELTSKRTGGKYHVCQREEAATKPQPARPQPADPLDEVYQTP